MMTRASCLDEAKRLVTKDRQDQHGNPEDTFGLIASFWSGYLGIEVKDYDVAVMMGLLKVARIKGKPLSEDSWLDAAGYVACGAELAHRNANKQIPSDFSPEC